MKKLIMLMMFFFGCGAEPRYVRVPAEEPPPSAQPPGGSTGKTSFAEARQLVGKYCEACHANSPWLRDARSLKASSSKARIQNNSMPPNNSPVKMGNAARKKLLDFF
tara:strand:+ start:752 stop:1072 length:321 start_codon:yes stop_codon:yes gene_type:complete